MAREERRRPHNRKETRKTGTRGKPHASWLILCEGEKTEPNYFKKFGIPVPRLLEVSGCKCTPDKIIEIAIKNKNDYDVIWCVFDRDEFPAQRFNVAFQRNENIDNIRIAYSNQSFELWYLLHFNFYDTPMHRDLLNTKLDEIMQREFNRRYVKNSKEMYNLLEAKQQIAINNSQNLLRKYNNPNPEQDNPSTTVHELVLELNIFRKEVEEKLKSNKLL